MPTYPTHNHQPWPKVGPLVICDHERFCGYCKGAAANKRHPNAAHLRLHVLNEHTDGGKLDLGGVEVKMCLPDEQPTNPAGNQANHLSKKRKAEQGPVVIDLTGETSVEDQAEVTLGTSQKKAKGNDTEQSGSNPKTTLSLMNSQLHPPPSAMIAAQGSLGSSDLRSPNPLATLGSEEAAELMQKMTQALVVFEGLMRHPANTGNVFDLHEVLRVMAQSSNLQALFDGLEGLGIGFERERLTRVMHGLGDFLRARQGLAASENPTIGGPATVLNSQQIVAGGRRISVSPAPVYNHQAKLAATATIAITTWLKSYPDNASKIVESFKIHRAVVESASIPALCEALEGLGLTFERTIVPHLLRASGFTLFHDPKKPLVPPGGGLHIATQSGSSSTPPAAPGTRVYNARVLSSSEDVVSMLKSHPDNASKALDQREVHRIMVQSNGSLDVLCDALGGLGLTVDRGRLSTVLAHVSTMILRAKAAGSETTMQVPTADKALEEVWSIANLIEAARVEQLLMKAIYPPALTVKQWLVHLPENAGKAVSLRPIHTALVERNGSLKALYDALEAQGFRFDRESLERQLAHEAHLWRCGRGVGVPNLLPRPSAQRTVAEASRIVKLLENAFAQQLENTKTGLVPFAIWVLALPQNVGKTIEPKDLAEIMVTSRSKAGLYGRLERLGLRIEHDEFERVLRERGAGWVLDVLTDRPELYASSCERSIYGHERDPEVMLSEF